MDEAKHVPARMMLFLGAALCSVVPAFDSAWASGAVRHVSLEDSLRQADVVLVVEPATPPTEVRKVYIPYRKNGKDKMMERSIRFHRFKVLRVLHRSGSSPASVTAPSYVRRGKKATLKPKEMVKKGRVVRVMSITTRINHHVTLRYLAEGVRKIPYYPRLDPKVAHKGKPRGKMVLAADLSPRYEALIGSPGNGLISFSLLPRIKSLLKAKRRPPGPPRANRTAEESR
jgi:hypothetical protein